MDIGNQQRVIIVEPEKMAVGAPMPAGAEPDPVHGEEIAAAWPLPLDIDQETEQTSS